MEFEEAQNKLAQECIFQECLFFEEYTPKNLKLIHQEIEVLEYVNAEDFVKRKLEEEDFYVIKISNLSVKMPKDFDYSLPVVGVYPSPGCPDFYCIGKKDTPSDGYQFYVEVKTKTDGLKEKQIQWIIDHPLDLIYAYYLKQKLIAKDGD